MVGIELGIEAVEGSEAVVLVPVLVVVVVGGAAELNVIEFELVATMSHV